MDISLIVKVMVAKGATVEQVSAVVEEVERQRNETLALQREKKRLQKRKERMMSHDVAATGGDKKRQEATGSDLSPPSNGFPPSSILLDYTPPSLTTPSLNSSFAEFWSAYPRKIGKGAALKAFKRALTKTDAETILKALRGYQWSSDKEFIPHASTWLNGERWADETTTTGEPKPDPTRKALHEMTEEERTRALNDYWNSQEQKRA